MNRRELLRMIASAAAALGLAKLPKVVAQRPDMLRGIPSKNVKPGETLHTEWIDLNAYDYIGWLPIDDVPLFALPGWELPAADRGWHTVKAEHVNCLCTYVIPPDEAENLRNGKWLIDGEWA